MRFSSKSRSNIALCASVFLHLMVWVALAIHDNPLDFLKKKPVEIIVIEKQEAAPAPKVLKKLQFVEQEKQKAKAEEPKDANFLSASNQKVEHETRATKAGTFKNVEKKADEKIEEKESEVAQESSTSQSDEYLKDVEAGMQTMLQTREFAYYNYYQSIREQVRKHWEPMVGEKVKVAILSDRDVASVAEHVTRIMLTIDETGAATGVELVGSSGLDAADSAAVEAFRKASPFGIPPKGLMNANGNVRIRWDLVLESSI
jgi:TonB family protein